MPDGQPLSSVYAPCTVLTSSRSRRYSHIPLTLLYSSLTKLFLLFCLSVWRPDATRHGSASEGSGGDGSSGGWSRPPLHPNATAFSHPLVVRALELLDEDKLDREWVVRNVLGGMAAGFGLRGQSGLPLSPLLLVQTTALTLG